MEKGGVIHVLLGKINFDIEKLKDNLLVAVEAIKKSKPSAVKGDFFKTVTISSTMGPGIKLDIRSAEEID